jgi:2-amino-4-hydroxy-6-hydroxymethyldihydropteridine diphosphokinase
VNDVAARACAAAGRSPDTKTLVYVGLGSNLGDRLGHLEGALRALEATPDVAVLEVSRFYETEPVGPPQPAYLNAVAKLSTPLSPRAVLKRLLEIERSEGRERGPQRNAPRTLDLDLLLYGELCLAEGDLILPHPRLHERGFVLEPLSDLAPGLVHPILRETIAVLANSVRDPAAVRPFPG